MDKLLIIVKPGSISTGDRQKLEDEGYLVIEGNPDDIKIGLPSSELIKDNGILKCALLCIEESISTHMQADFAKRISKVLRGEK